MCAAYGRQNAGVQKARAVDREGGNSRGRDRAGAEARQRVPGSAQRSFFEQAFHPFDKKIGVDRLVNVLVGMG